MTFAFDEQFTMFDVTPVENQFILEQLPGAKGDYVKVYLYGLMHCYHPREDVTPESMGRELNIPVEDILLAFRYWERHGAVRRISDHPPAWQYVSFRQRMVMPHADDVDPEYAAFSRELENAFEGKRVFRGSEAAAIYEWKEGSMQLPTEVILMVLSHMIKVRGKSFKISEAEKLATKLAEENARTEEEAAEVLSRDEAATKGMREILRQLGKNYAPSMANMKLYFKWTREWGFSQKAILEACEQMGAKDPNLGLLDTILKETYENREPGNKRELGEKDVRDSQELFRQKNDLMKALGRPGMMTPYQNNLYNRMLEMYPYEIVLLAATECGRKGRSFDSLMKLLKSWQDRGFTTQGQVETHIRIFRDKEDFLKTLRSRWQSREADPGGTHMEMVTRWEEELGLSRELILKAADYAADTKNPMSYMNALMGRYAEKGIRTPEEAEKDRKEHSAQYKEIAQKATEKKLPAQDYHQRDLSGAQEAAFERMMNMDSEEDDA